MWSNLIELKTMLEIDLEDRSEDVRLAFWLKMACDVLESYLGQPIFKMERTEFYGGSGTQKLVLKAKPAWATPTVRVWVDEQGRFGVPDGTFPAEKELEYGTDFSLWLDDGEDGTKSSRAILLRNSGLWNKASVRQVGLLSPFIQPNPGTIKVTYTGGRAAEDLPYDWVLAAVQTTARIRFMMPLGLDVTGDSYEGRNVHIKSAERNWLIGQVKHLLFKHKDRRF